MIGRGPGGRFSGPVGLETDPWDETWSRRPDAGAPGPEESGTLTAGDVMTRDVRSCRKTATLASAALTMSRGDCRFLPVLDEAGRPVGVITDGDICLLGATDYRPLRDVFVSEAMSQPVMTCRSDGSIGEVLSLMRSRRIRHVPVADDRGLLVGLISMTDLVLAVEKSAPRGTLGRELVSALREICQSDTKGCRAADRHFMAD